MKIVDVKTVTFSYKSRITPDSEGHTHPGPEHDSTQTMLTVPNFYRLEFGRANLDLYNAFVTPSMDVRDGVLHLSDRPRLGVDLNLEYIEAHPDRRE